jgi:predicted phage terminase large subunit-like protein
MTLLSPTQQAECLANANRIFGERDANKKYEANLLDFAKYMWPVVEPAIEFDVGWAIEAIAEHLQAVTEGHIRRLLINVPPGFTKSLMTDVFWPAWEWGPRNMPWLRYMCAAYSNHLTERDNMRCRNIIISDRYRKFWGKRFGISNEQFTKVKFSNTETGWKLATSVGGIGTGERADRVIIDDPNNPMEMESEAIRKTAIMWFTEIIPDRLNSQKDSAIVVIQQRTHEDDVSGTAISREMGYTHLMIPMRYDPSRHCTTIIGYDPKTGQDKTWNDKRSEDGELAWPSRFPEQITDDLERDKGPYAWAGQYQQMPAPRGGSIIKDHFWQLWREEKYPTFEFILASLDTAMTAKDENNPSALTVWGVFREDTILKDVEQEILWMPRQGQTLRQISGNPKIMLLWAWKGHLDFGDLVEKVIATCIPSPSPTSHPRFPVDRLLIEGKANGQAVAQELERMFRGSGRLGIEIIDPKQYGDKTARAISVQHMFADQMVYAPDKAWADMVIKQCALFPRGSEDDLVDTTTQALRYLRDTGFVLRRAEHEMEVEESLRYHSSGALRPLYPV